MLEGLTTDTGYSTMGMTFDGEEPTPHKVNKEARFCECGTKLSMYNLTGTCYRHQKGIAF